MSLEKPLLLNPEINEPKLHFKFQFDGKIVGVTNKGKKTIEICRLNRDELKIARQRILDEFLSELKEVLLAYELKIIDNAGLKYFIKKILEKIKRLQSPENIFALFGWYIYEEYEIFFVNPLATTTERQRFLKQAFQAFRKGHL